MHTHADARRLVLGLHDLRAIPLYCLQWQAPALCGAGACWWCEQMGYSVRGCNMTVYLSAPVRCLAMRSALRNRHRDAFAATPGSDPRSMAHRQTRVEPSTHAKKTAAKTQADALREAARIRAAATAAPPPARETSPERRSRLYDAEVKTIEATKPTGTKGSDALTRGT